MANKAGNRTKAKRIEIWERAKGLYDGCATLEEMAQRLEAQAAALREMAKDGVTLTDEVADDYANLELRTADPKLIAKYEPQEVA